MDCSLDRCCGLYVAQKKARLEQTFVASCRRPTSLLDDTAGTYVQEMTASDFSCSHPFSGVKSVSVFDTSSES